MAVCRRYLGNMRRYYNFLYHGKQSMETGQAIIGVFENHSPFSSIFKRLYK